MFEKFFKLSQNKTNVKTEVMAGVTTFLAMAYILAVNPSILSVTGMDAGALFVATALASCIGTVLMALLTNYPFALAPGMGLNAFFAFTVVLGMGYTWQFALTAVLVEGIIFIILSLTGVRESIFNAIPITLKHAISAGIGLFIAFIGLQNAKIVVKNDSTCVSLFDFSTNFHSLGITVLLAIIGILITSVLLVKKVKGAILLGILATWILGIICQATKVYIPNEELGIYSLIPSGIFSLPPSIAPIFCKFEWSHVLSLDFVVVVLSFFFVDVFDTLGTVTGVASSANMLDKNGKLPKIKGVLTADAIATTAGACLGTSTTTTFVESASGVAVGGKTGLTAMITGLLFLLSLIFSPIFLAIPSFATAPALVAVGFLIFIAAMKKLAVFEDYADMIPAYLCIIAMPFMYSISDGISLGIISYVTVNLVTGKAKEKKISPIMYVLAILFILKYALL